MRTELLQRFDAVMAKIKSVEPSSSFDFEFRKRLEVAVAKKYEETAFERLARKTTENVRYLFLPKVPALVRVAATFIVLLALGLYTYFIQPANPTLLARGELAQIVKIGDFISTEKDYTADIILPDKYTVRLKEDSRVKIAKLTPRYGKGKALFELLDGKILISIEEDFKGSRFVVKTKSATTTALGTKFAVDLSREDRSTTEISVVEGKVEVRSHHRPEKILLAEQTVTVGAGQKTKVSVGEIPIAPQRLIEKEWKELEELYQIGKRPQVALLIKNTPDRVKQLLRPCPIYISDEKPRVIPDILEKAVLKIEEALKTGDEIKHIESIKLLERIVEEYPNPKYDVQFLLYIGAYYEYLDYHREAISAFEKVLGRYPDSPLASLAVCAIGLIYEEKLNDRDTARHAYNLILGRYPNSLEAIWVEQRLGIKKVAKFIK